MSSNQALRARSLARAAELCGGPDQLASYLGITGTKLAYMLDGSASVPDEVFLKVVDLLVSRHVADLMERAKGGAASSS